MDADGSGPTPRDGGARGGGAPPEGRPPGPGVPAVAGATIVLAAIAVLGALYAARAVAMPIAFAAMLYLLLRPPVDVLERLRVPRGIGAAVMIAAAAAVVGGITVTSWRPALKWAERVPVAVRQLEERARSLRDPMVTMQQVAERVEEMTDVDGEGGAPQVEVRGRGVVEHLLGGARAAAGTAAIAVATLFFFLVYGHSLLGAAATAGKVPEETGPVLVNVRSTEREISRYLLTISAINGTLGLTVAATMWLLGMPNPWLWGVLAAVVNFVPYLGSLACSVVVAVVALSTFPDSGRAVWPVAAYLALTATEGTFVTPVILGRTQQINPLVVFVWLLLWGWLWGVGGLLIAVPLLVTVKIACSRVPALRPVAEAIGR